MREVETSPRRQRCRGASIERSSRPPFSSAASTVPRAGGSPPASLHARRIRRDAAVERSRCGDVAPCAHDPSTSGSVIAAAARTQSLAPKWWRADRRPPSAVKARKSSRCSIRVEQASSGWQSGTTAAGQCRFWHPGAMEHLTAQAGTLAHASHAKPMRRRTASSSRRCVAEEALTSPRRPFGRHPHLSHSSSHQRDAAGRGRMYVTSAHRCSGCLIGGRCAGRK